MIFHIQDFARLSVVVMLYAIWSARRVEHANIQWAAAYMAMTVADVAYAQAVASTLLVLIQIFAGVVAALLMWSGAERFRHRSAPPLALSLSGAAAVVY